MTLDHVKIKYDKKARLESIKVRIKHLKCKPYSKRKPLLFTHTIDIDFLAQRRYDTRASIFRPRSTLLLRLIAKSRHACRTPSASSL